MEQMVLEMKLLTFTYRLAGREGGGLGGAVLVQRGVGIELGAWASWAGPPPCCTAGTCTTA